MKNGTKEDILYVRTFGGFSMIWNQSFITGKTKSGESQFTYLMQILLHNCGKGVGRDQLEEFLFGDREINNPHHALQSVIHNAKKKLRKAGLPEVNYIEQRNGVFYWTEKIPVSEDAQEFENLYRKAQDESVREKKQELYLEACRRYTGEFLPLHAGVIWAAQEAKRYRSMFCRCVEEAVRLLRESGDFLRMEELGLYAAGVNPLADWESVTMEAYVSMGRYEEARKLYEDTADFYMKEQGMRPSGRMMELLHKLGAQMEHSYEVLDTIQERLAEEDLPGEGGYLCTYPVFRGIYHIVQRMLERNGQSVYLMLCTIVDSKGNPMKDGPMLEELSERLEESIRMSVRHGDVINKYGKGQYLVLLVNTTRENCSVVQKRIDYHFLVGRQRTGVEYYVNSVISRQEHSGGVKLSGIFARKEESEKEIWRDRAGI